MPKSTTNPDLATFAKTGDDRAFAKVVAQYSGLVYASALRRTGNRSSAEEVTQNVFVSAAKKAESLVSHPSLVGWFYSACKFESINLIRSQNAHAKRVKALEKFMETDAELVKSEWRNANQRAEILSVLDQSLDRLNKAERQIILQRFFENRSFREISKTSRSSEAALKMRLKRALEKLQRVMTSRGATISMGTLTLALGSELSKAAPVGLVTSLSAPSALTLVKGGNHLVQNLIPAMKLSKNSLIIACSLIPIVSIPWAYLKSQEKDLSQQIQQLESKLALEKGNQKIASKLGKRDAWQVARNRSHREILDQLDSSNYLLSPKNQALSSIIMNLDPASYKRLVKEFIETWEERGYDRELVLRSLVNSAPIGLDIEAKKEFIGHFVKQQFNEINYEIWFEDWTQHDADELFAWMNKSEISNALQRRDVIVGILVTAYVNQAPQKALSLLKSHLNTENRETLIMWKLSQAVAEYDRINGSQLFGDFVQIFRESDQKTLKSHHYQLSEAGRFVYSIATDLNLEQGFAFAEKHLADHPDLELLTWRLADQEKFASSENPFSWLHGKIPAKNLSAIIQGETVSGSKWDRAFVAVIANPQDYPSAEKDFIIRSWLGAGPEAHGMYDIPFQSNILEMIDDGPTKEGALEDLARYWLLEDFEKYSSQFPEDLVEKYRY